MLEVAIVFHEVVVFSELARLEYGKELDCVEIEDCTASTVVNSAAKAETEFTNRNANANGKCLSKKLKIMDNKNINKTNINWDILTHEKLRF